MYRIKRVKNLSSEDGKTLSTTTLYAVSLGAKGNVTAFTKDIAKAGLLKEEQCDANNAYVASRAHEAMGVYSYEPLVKPAAPVVKPEKANGASKQQGSQPVVVKE